MRVPGGRGERPVEEKEHRQQQRCRRHELEEAAAGVLRVGEVQAGFDRAFAAEEVAHLHRHEQREQRDERADDDDDLDGLKALRSGTSKAMSSGAFDRATPAQSRPAATHAHADRASST